MMLTFDVKPWQIAALLGMDEALNAAFSHAIEDVKDSRGYTILHYYVVGGHENLVRDWFTRYKPFFKAQTDDDYELAELAAAAGHASLLAMLKRIYGYDLKRFNEELQITLIHCAVEFGQTGTAKWLIEKVGVDPGKGRNLLLLAAEYTRLNFYDYFVSLNQGRQLTNAEFDELIIHVARFGGKNYIMDLTEKNSDEVMKGIRFKGKSILLSAVCGGQYELVKYCIDRGWGEIDQRWNNGLTILHVAAGQGQVKLIAQLLEEYPEKLDVQTVDDFNRSLLFSSAMHGDFAKFWSLYTQYFSHEDCFKPDIGGKTIVHIACHSGCLIFLKALIQKLGDNCLSQTDQLNRTALHYASLSCNPALVEWLVKDHKFLLSAEDTTGKTPLHVLAEDAQNRPQLWNGLPWIAEKYGIEYITDFRDKDGMSVKDYLEAANRPTVLREINAMCRYHHVY